MKHCQAFQAGKLRLATLVNRLEIRCSFSRLGKSSSGITANPRLLSLVKSNKRVPQYLVKELEDRLNSYRFGISRFGVAPSRLFLERSIKVSIEKSINGGRPPDVSYPDRSIFDPIHLKHRIIHSTGSDQCQSSI